LFVIEENGQGLFIFAGLGMGYLNEYYSKTAISNIMEDLKTRKIFSPIIIE